MKKTVIKLTACALSFLFIVGLLPIKSFADSSYNSTTQEAISFIDDKGLFIGDILDIEHIENGERFTVQYLPDGEESYITYLKVDDGIKIIVREHDKENEIYFKDNGQVFLDGTRYELFETVNNQISEHEISTYASPAISYYHNFSDVPGYSYWKTQSFKTSIAASEKTIEVTSSMTVTALAYGISQLLGTGDAGFYAVMASGALQHISSNVLEKGILYVKYNVLYMYNPTNVQYLYKTSSSGYLNGSNVGSEVVYELNTY